MDWVLRHLKSLLRKERGLGKKHTPLAADKLYAASAQFSKERVPQIEQAIKILENHKPEEKKEVKLKKKATNQLNIFK